MIGYRLYWAQSASIKAIVNGEMSVACPATRWDGRRRLRLRKRKEPKITLKVRYLKVFKLQTWNFKVRKWKSSNLSHQTWNCESEKLETSKCESKNLQTWVFKLQTAKVRNFKLQTWVFKLETSNYESESSKLRAESFQLLSFDKLQVLKPEN